MTDTEALLSAELGKSLGSLIIAKIKLEGISGYEYPDEFFDVERPDILKGIDQAIADIKATL